jgi:hypothetical protein
MEARQNMGKPNRGSVNNGKRLASLLARTAAGGIGKADWGNARPEWVLAVICAVGKMGGLTSFGYSRDGNAYNLTILLDGERETLWFNGDADLDEELRRVYEAFTEGA